LQMPRLEGESLWMKHLISCSKDSRRKKLSMHEYKVIITNHALRSMQEIRDYIALELLKDYRRYSRDFSHELAGKRI
jgi:hypothetical protein